MTEPVDVLVLDLLEWVGTTSRPYAEVMEAWRTSCPRLTVWEEANDRGFVERYYEPGSGAVVRVSPSGMRHLRVNRLQPTRSPNLGEFAQRPRDASGLPVRSR